MLARVFSAIRDRRFATDDRGFVMVYVALSLVVIMGFVAVVLDFGSLALNYRTSQNAVDTAAFAAAEAARTDSTGTITVAAIAAIVNPIIARYGYAAGELTLTYLDSSNAVVAPPAAMKVRAQIDHQVATTLAHSLIAGASAQSLETTRSAALIGSGPDDAFYIMGGGTHTVFVNSVSSVLDLSGGGFYVNSTSVNAFQVISGQINVSSPNTITEAGSSPCGGCSPSVSTVPAIPDPFANVPVPTLSGPRKYFNDVTLHGDNSLKSGSLTINPGFYNSITVAGGTLTMNPGTYVISSQFSISSGTVTGIGVTLYFTCGGTPASVPLACNTPKNGANLSLTGGTYTLKAPTSGIYQGLLVFYDRNNTSPLTITGMTTTDDLIGSVYAILSTLTMAGNTTASLFNSALVIADIKITGNSTLSISYGGGSQYRKGGASGGTAW
jgi:Flp pilus assembly protein TadG